MVGLTKRFGGGPRFRRGLWLAPGGHGDLALPSYPFDPRDMAGATFWLPTHSTSSLWVDVDSGGAVATRPAAGDLIGFIQEPIGACKVATTNTSQRPTLNSDATRGGYLTFGTGRQLIIANSLGAFRHFHVGRIGYICCWVRFAGPSDGSNRNTILDSIAMTGANKGINLRRETNNTIAFQIGTGSTILALTSTATVNASGDTGWHSIVVKVAAGSNACSLTIDGGTPVTGTVGSPAADGTDATANLQIGLRTSGTLPMLGDLAHLVIGATALDSGDLANWLAYDPPISSDSLERYAAAGNALSPAEISGLYSWYDFSDVATMYTNNPPTVAVAGDTDPIKYVANKKGAPSGCSWKRDAFTTVDAKRPLYRTNISGGLGCGQWTGTATDVMGGDYSGEQNLDMAQWERGSKTWAVVFRNLDSLLGSHPLVSNSGASAVYQTWVGSAYSGVSARNRVVQHWSGGTAIDSAENLNGGEGWGIAVVRQDGRTATIVINNVAGETATDADQFRPLYIGRPAIQNWDPNGYLAEVACFGLALSDGTIRKLTNYFATKYAIPNAYQ